MILQDDTQIGLKDFWHAGVSIRGFRDNRENVRGNPGPLSVASACNMVHSVVEMLENGMDVNEAGGFPIQAAAHGRHHRMLLLLLDHGARVNNLARRKPLDLGSKLCMPLRKYCALSSEGEGDGDGRAAVTSLLDRGLERIPADEMSCSSILCLAALRVKPSMVKILLERSKPMPQHEQYATSAMLALVILGRPNNHPNVTTCYVAVLESLDNTSRRRCLDRALGWIAATFTEPRYLYLASFLLEERLKLDAVTKHQNQQEIQHCRHIILQDGPFEAIGRLGDIRVETAPKVTFTTDEPEMATYEVHIFFPAQNDSLRRRWLQDVASKINPILASGPGARPRIQIFI